MNRLFRHSNPGLSGYAALALFAVAYLSVMALIIAPRSMTSSPAADMRVETRSP